MRMLVLVLVGLACVALGRRVHGGIISASLGSPSAIDGRALSYNNVDYDIDAKNQSHSPTSFVELAQGSGNWAANGPLSRMIRFRVRRPGSSQRNRVPQMQSPRTRMLQQTVPAAVSTILQHTTVRSDSANILRRQMTVGADSSKKRQLQQIGYCLGTLMLYQQRECRALLKRLLGVFVSRSALETSPSMSAVEALKSDVRNMLHKEPRWKAFSKEFSLSGPSGATLFGLDGFKKFTYLLSALRTKFVVKDVRVDFFEKRWVHSVWRNARLEKETHKLFNDDPRLIVQWRVKLNLRQSEDEPLTLETQAVFNFDKNGTVTNAQIRKTFVNGIELLHWPRINLTDTRANNFVTIEQWLRGIKDDTRYESRCDEGCVFDMGHVPTSGIETVTHALKKDVSRIFSHEPSWSILAEDFSLIDQTGNKWIGLDTNKLLWKFVNRVSRKFIVADFHVNFFELNWLYSTWHDRRVEGTFQEPYRETICAKIKLKLRKRRNIFQNIFQLLQFGRKQDLVSMTAIVSFHINDDNQIDSATIREVLVDDWSLLLWPEVDLSGDFVQNLIEVEKWFEFVKQSTHKQIPDSE